MIAFSVARSLLVALALIALTPSILVASSCEPLSPSEQAARADAIVDVTVVSITPGEAWSEVTLRVDAVLKGSPGDPLVLRGSLPGEGVVGEVPFAEWPYWRLYLRETEPGSGRYYTSRCDGSHERPAPAASSAWPATPCRPNAPAP